jgi:hypothetical protein
MGTTVLREKVRTARKEYSCSASEWFLNGYSITEFIDDYKLPFSERRILAKAKAERFKVLPGTKYLEQTGVYEGDFACLKCRLDMVELINKYGINEE